MKIFYLVWGIKRMRSSQGVVHSLDSILLCLYLPPPLSSPRSVFLASPVFHFSSFTSFLFLRPPLLLSSPPLSLLSSSSFVFTPLPFLLFLLLSSFSFLAPSFPLPFSFHLFRDGRSVRNPGT